MRARARRRAVHRAARLQRRQPYVTQERSHVQAVLHAQLAWLGLLRVTCSSLNEYQASSPPPGCGTRHIAV